MKTSGLIPTRVEQAKRVKVSPYLENRIMEKVNEEDEAGYDTRFQVLGLIEQEVNEASWKEWARAEESRPLLPDTLVYEKKPFISLTAFLP